jgi:hypothetical protein
MPKARTATVRVPSFTAAGTAYTLELPPKLAERILEASSGDSASSAGAATGKPAPKTEGKKPQKTAPMTVSIVLAPDGAETWFAVAATQRAAVEKLVLAHGEAGAKLGSLPGLEPLKASSSVSGGFTTLESLTRLFSEVAEKNGVNLAAGLTKVPEHGRTPILWWGVAAETGKEVVVGARMRVPQAAIADAGALILQSAGR